MATILLMFLNGIPLGGGFMAHSLMADVVDYDELLNGARSEGIFWWVFQMMLSTDHHP